MRDLIKESRKKFVQKAVNDGMGKGEAERQAEKLIGATWDVSHINVLRKHGVEEKKILEETRKIIPYIKKVHLADNMGFADNHVAPGMGNVQIKENLKDIIKSGFKGKVIAELGGLHNAFKPVSAYHHALESIGSTLYSPSVASYYYSVPSSAARAALIPESDYGWAPLTKELGGRTQKSQYSSS